MPITLNTNNPSRVLDTAETIEVVCATDEAYVPHLAALLKSIERSKGIEAVRVHLIFDSVDDELAHALEASVPGLILQTYHVSQHPALELPPLLQISRATYLRLMMDEVLDPAIERIIFLDVDMIVTTSLQELWHSDLAGQIVGAVPDPGVNAADFARRHDIQGLGAYLNAGMLVVDMTKAREAAIFPQALRYLLANPKSFEFADQDALNLVLWQSWTALDTTWNFQRKFLYEDFHHLHRDNRRALPGIVHFTETVKPWQAREWHPLEWLYWRALRHTPFFRAVTKREGIGRRRLLKSQLRFLLRRRPSPRVHHLVALAMRRRVLRGGAPRATSDSTPPHRPSRRAAGDPP